MSTSRRSTTAARLAIVAAAAAALLIPGPALAHMFLVQSHPAPGEHLAEAPRQVTLEFSEPVAGEPFVEVSPVGGEPIELMYVGVEADRRRVVANVPPLEEAVYDVFFRVEGADPHATEGQFAFAVGDASVSPMHSTVRSGGDFDLAAAFALAALLLGVLVAIGGLVSESTIWRDQVRCSLVPPAPVGPALTVAAAGAIAGVLLRVERLDAGWWPWTWHTELSAGSDRAALAVTGFVAGAMIGVRRARLRPAMTWVLVIAAALTAWQGHSSSSGGFWGAASIAHVAFAGVWFGALVHLAAIARRCRHQGIPWPGVARYARLALASVVVAMTIGVSLAVRALDEPADMVTSRYGRVLSVKLGLVVVALALAGLARRSAHRPEDSRGALSTLTRLEALSVAAVVVASATLATTSPPENDQFVLGPSPLPSGALWSADLAGSQLVLMGVADDRMLVRVLAPGGQPLDDDVHVDITVTEPDGTDIDIAPRSCGPGCAELNRQWADGTTHVAAAVGGGAYEGGTAQLEIQWPPGPPADDLLAGAVAATRRLPQIEITESVRSGIEAVSGPYTGALSGRAFVASQPYASGAVDIHRLTDDGEMCVLSLLVPGSNIWATLWVGPDDLTIRRAVLVDPGHRVEQEIRATADPGADSGHADSPTRCTG